MVARNFPSKRLRMADDILDLKNSRQKREFLPVPRNSKTSPSVLNSRATPNKPAGDPRYKGPQNPFDPSKRKQLPVPGTNTTKASGFGPALGNLTRPDRLAPKKDPWSKESLMRRLRKRF